MSINSINNYIWIGSTNYYVEASYYPVSKIENYYDNKKLMQCIFNKYTVDILITFDKTEDEMNKECDIMFSIYNKLKLEDDYDNMFVEWLRCAYNYIKESNYKNNIIKLMFINGQEIIKKYIETEIYFLNHPT